MTDPTATPANAIDKERLGREVLRRARQRPLHAYRDFTVGGDGWGALARYELLTGLLGPLPGGLGFLLRGRLYPRLLAGCGGGLFVGRNVTLRHPGRMRFGEGVTVDELSLLDARGAGDPGLVLEDGVIVNRNCMLQAKSGPIRLGAGTTLGSNSVVVSMAGVEIGAGVMMAGGVYISPGAYRFADPERAIMAQEAFSKGPIVIEDHTWIGTGAVVLDGVRIGRGAVVGAGAVVTRDVPSRTVVAGVPARVVRRLEGTEQPGSATPCAE